MFFKKLQTFLPHAEVSEDDQGQIVIYTAMMDGDRVGQENKIVTHFDVEES
jgi:uncharacterized protein YrzB (UPF0473 family)